MFKRVLITLAILLATISPIAAYIVPEEYYYFRIEDRQLGEVYIYLPIVDFQFSKNNENPVNVGSSNVTGYMTYRDSEYTVSFQPYQYGRYRLDNYTSYSYLDVVDIIDTNVPFINDTTTLLNSSYSYILLVLVGLGVFALWIPSLRR